MRKLLIAAMMVLGVLVGLVAAVPAFATCAPGSGDAVNACAAVPQSITLTGLTADIDFGSVSPGTTGTVTGAEAYTASTNDSKGYDLTVTGSGPTLPCSVGMSGGGFCGTLGGGSADVLPNKNDLTITETASAAGTLLPGNAASSGVTIQATTSASSNSYSEDWALSVPATQEADSYTETFTYKLQAN